jgi:hypothetical protein
MKIAAGISTLWIVTLLTSCMRDNSGSQPLMIKDIIINGGCEIFYTYDANNRCTSINECDTVETYTYSQDSVIDVKTSGGIFIYKNIYKLNSAGLATGYVSLSQGGGLVAKYTFTYDRNGHRLSAIDSTITNTTDDYTIQNNDVVLETSSSTAILGNNYSISTIFYTGTVNRLGNANYGLSFLGSSSANLKKADNMDNQLGQYTVNYTYTLNNVNGVAQQISTVNGIVVDSRHYDYY